MRFGIDFGTTHTVVATIDRGNYPIVSFEHADVIPSIVSSDPEGELHFGRAEPDWTVFRSFKRLLDEGHPETEVRIGNRAVPLAELLTRFLAHVRDQILHHSNAGLRKKDKVEAAVSVPANASTAQRLITMDAYRRAGFEVKASATVRARDFAGLAHLRDRLGERFRVGLVVYALVAGSFAAWRRRPSSPSPRNIPSASAICSSSRARSREACASRVSSSAWRALARASSRSSASRSTLKRCSTAARAASSSRKG